MNPVPWLALAAVIVVLVIAMLVSRRHERRLRAEGAVEPPDDVYGLLRVVYPGCFVTMAVEGWLRGAPPYAVLVAGTLTLVLAKALKAWVIVSLGTSWSFHVLVRPAHRLVTGGPYRYLRHPNYLGIAGEIIGMAMLVGAPATGVVSLAAMALLLRKRIRVEER